MRIVRVAVVPVAVACSLLACIVVLRIEIGRESTALGKPVLALIGKMRLTGYSRPIEWGDSPVLAFLGSRHVGVIPVVFASQVDELNRLESPSLNLDLASPDPCVFAFYGSLETWEAGIPGHTGSIQYFLVANHLFVGRYEVEFSEDMRSVSIVLPDFDFDRTVSAHAYFRRQSDPVHFVSKTTTGRRLGELATVLEIDDDLVRAWNAGQADIGVTTVGTATGPGASRIIPADFPIVSLVVNARGR